jgi:ATP-binding cassette subfamily C protein CydC
VIAFSLLLPLYLKRRWRLLGSLALALATVAAGVGLLGVAGWFLSAAAVAGAAGSFNLFAPSALVRGLSMLRIVCRYGERLAGHALTLHWLSDLRGSVFRGVIRLTPRQLARFRGGDLVARLTGDVDVLDTAFLLVAAPLLTALAGGVLFTATVGYWIPWSVAVLAPAILLVCAVVPATLVRASRASGAALQRNAADMRSAVLDAVEGHADLWALHAGSAASDLFARHCGQTRAARNAQTAIAARGQAVLHAVGGLSALGVFCCGIGVVREGALSGAALAGFVLATLGLFEVAAPVARGAARMGAARAAAQRVSTVARLAPDLSDPEAPTALPASGEIRLENVSYAYPAASGRAAMPVLRDFSLVVRAGERIAIQAPSGAGKSTLLQLLTRLDDPTAGRILFGGCDLRAARQADVYRRFALLTQDAPIFLGTVRTNLLIGDSSAGETLLWQALAAARLDDFVRGLPQGLDTWTGESGATLSAGQGRRLCLARALLSPAPVILLDEPTAGLDAATEQAFLADLRAATRGRTVILATHAVLPDGAVDRIVPLHMAQPDG